MTDDAAGPPQPQGVKPWSHLQSLSSTGPGSAGDYYPGGDPAGGGAGSGPGSSGNAGGRLFSPAGGRRSSVDALLFGRRGRSQSQNDNPAPAAGGGGPLSKASTWGSASGSASAGATAGGLDGPASFPPRPPQARNSSGTQSVGASIPPGGGFRPGRAPEAGGYQQGLPAGWAEAAAGAAPAPTDPPQQPPEPAAPRANESFGSRDVALELCDSDSELGAAIDDAATDSGFEIRARECPTYTLRTRKSHARGTLFHPLEVSLCAAADALDI